MARGFIIATSFISRCGEFARQNHANKKYWSKAFAFLKNHDLSKLAPAKNPIDGDNVYASVTEDPTKDFDKSQWESHRKYVDLQYVFQVKKKSVFLLSQM